MKIPYYAIKDLKIGFHSMQGFPNDDAAKRAFLNAATAPGTVLHQSPADFEFWRIGFFDESIGTFTPDLVFIANIGNPGGSGNE